VTFCIGCTEAFSPSNKFAVVDTLLTIRAISKCGASSGKLTHSVGYEN